MSYKILVFTVLISAILAKPALSLASERQKSIQLPQRQVTNKLAPINIQISQDNFTPSSTREKSREKIFLREFKIVGNTVFLTEQLLQLLAPYQNQEFLRSQLPNIASVITDFYTKNKYITSFAFVQNVRDNIATIQVIEGKLEKIKVEIPKGVICPQYIKDRLRNLENKPLNSQEIKTALATLYFNENIEQINFDLEKTEIDRPDSTTLNITADTVSRFNLTVGTDNRRNPFVGEINRRVVMGLNSILVCGDRALAGYIGAEGSQGGDFLYTVPVGLNDARLTLKTGINSNAVIANPFAEANPETNFNYVEVDFAYPVIQSPTQNLALGLVFSRLSTESFILERPVPLSRGADDLGRLKDFVIRFAQSYIWRQSTEKLELYSQFSLGSNVFEPTATDERVDSNFFIWQGEGKYSRYLNKDIILVTGGFLQFTPDSLTGLEQAYLGGLDSVRGYRVAILNGDNAARGSIEIRFIIWRPRENMEFQVVPFFDVGTVRNNNITLEDNLIASTGLELRFIIFNKLDARLGFGIPWVEVPDRNLTDSFQEKGGYFSLIWRLLEF